jgi:hypothetical protein
MLRQLAMLSALPTVRAHVIASRKRIQCSIGDETGVLACFKWLQANRASGARLDSWVCVGVGALFTAVFSRLLISNLLFGRRRRTPMTTKLHLFAASLLETISSTGTDIAAGTLLA